MSLLSNASGQKLTGSFTIQWDDCRVVDASLAVDRSGKVYTNQSHGVSMQCIRKGQLVTCDYIDEKTGKLYAANTGDCSVTVYDLNDDYRLLKYIDVGTTIEDLTISPLDGTLFLRNRLGGSEIYNLDLATSTLHTISNGDRVGTKGIGLWPTSLLSKA